MLIANTKFDIQNESGGVLTLAERSHINDILQIDLHLHFDELTTPENVNARPQRRNCCIILLQSPSVDCPVLW